MNVHRSYFLTRSSLAIIFVLLVSGVMPRVSAQVCASAPVGLVSWWSGDGNALDSRSRNNGTLENGATFAAGEVGQGFNFDGIDDQISIPHNTNQNVGSNLTIEAWINPTSLIHGETILQKRSTSNTGGYVFEPTQPPGSPNGLHFVIMIGGVYKTLNPANVLAAGVWQHVAATYDGAFMRIYVNGIQVASQAQTGPIDPVSDPIVIGRNVVSSVPFGGEIDEVGLYNRTLSATEIQAIFNAGTAGKCKPTATAAPVGQVAWFGGDGNANDISGNGNDGPLGTTTFFAVGKVGQAIQFDGTQFSQILVPDAPSLRPTTAVTVEAWVNPSSVASGFQGVLFKGNTGSAGGQPYSLFVNGSGSTRNIVIRVGNDSTFDGAGSIGEIPVDVYSHVGFTYDGTTVRIFINGVLDSSVASSIGPLAQNDNSPLRIGGLGSSYAFTGGVDEIGVYDRALSDTEIQSILSAGIAGKLKDGATSAGSNITVSTNSDATVTFPTVVTAGTTQQIPVDISLLPALPAGSTFTGLASDISTSATFSGTPTLCFHLPSLSAAQFLNLGVLHLEGGVWVDRGTGKNTDARVICASSPTLSPFAIAQVLSPSAAGVSIGGRVLTAEGSGVRNATVQLTDIRGNVRSTLTSSFGYYRFENVEVGQTVTVAVASKRYVFAPRILSVNDAVEGFDFIASP